MYDIFFLLTKWIELHANLYAFFGNIDDIFLSWKPRQRSTRTTIKKKTLLEGKVPFDFFKSTFYYFTS